MDKEKELDRALQMSKMVMEQPIEQQSDLTGMMKTFNEDIIEKDTGFPSIDMKTRLAPFEITSHTVHDTVIALQCLPLVCLTTTRIKKRLSVSENGKGREEMVRIVQGERDKEGGAGFMGKMKNMFTPAQR